MAPEPLEVTLGMTADEVLRQPGRTRFDAVAPAQWLKQGQSAVWHYADCSLVFEHDGLAYRVVEVVTGVAEASLG